MTEKNTVGTLGSIGDTALDIFHTWEVDYAGPFSLDQGNRKVHIALFIDCRSRFLLTDIVESLTTEAYIELLDRLIKPLGLPRRIHADRGRNFTALRAIAWGNAIGCDMTFGLAYHHRAQGMVERPIREIRESMDSCLLQYANSVSFEQALRAATEAHNHRPHTRTGVSPFQYISGRTATDSINRFFDSADDPRKQRTYREIHDQAIADEYMKASEEYASTARPSRIAQGMTVFRLYRQDNSKVIRTGPHKVLQRIGSNSWLIAPDPSMRFVNRHLRVPESQLKAVIDAEHLWGDLPRPDWSHRSVPRSKF
jgi:hypothetical protein